MRGLPNEGEPLRIRWVFRWGHQVLTSISKLCNRLRVSYSHEASELGEVMIPSLRSSSVISRRAICLGSLGSAIWSRGLLDLLTVHQAAAAGITGVFIEPEDGRAPVIDEIAAAQESITLHIYLLTDDLVRNTLRDAVERGVWVRVILEEHPFGGDGDQPETFAWLDDNGIDVRWSNPRFAYSHVKTMTVDERVALIMNLNLTEAAFTRNREIGIVTTDPLMVAEAVSLFEADWSRADEPKAGPLVVSPIDARQTILRLISEASDQLDIYAEVLRDPEIISALINAADREVMVRAAISPTEESAMPIWEDLARRGVAIRIISDVYIHAKLLIADKLEAFVGSQNLTEGSLDRNREIGIILNDDISLQRLSALFDWDFRYGVALEAR